MAMSAAAKATLEILTKLAQKKEPDQISPLVIVLCGTLAAGLVMFGGIFCIATSPVGFTGAAGDLQWQISQILPHGSQSIPGSADGYSDTEIQQMVTNISDPRRKAVVAAGLSLVGRVPYFWGGKPSGPGWDDRWNTPRLVTAPGVSASGSYRPYGLDCGGFVRWAYWTGLGDAPAEQGSSTLWWVSDPITEDELLPGDLVFKNVPSSEIGHVGIYYGRDADGKKLYIHCSSSGGGVVLNDWSGFQYFRRLPMIEEAP